ncbi:NAD(P)/FAD-dependent oxidoreductase [Desulfovibrio ferrophilus]|uniref:Thioredoxin-disulfide reductase n=1 Tax=Desulfovibrio ferrophilus TaxID=241368 RepID=A0A2Z6AX50_9BACT|nr:NAD(P)/FAD-dependent oxidoreductase [Desulfovibrio ferrophilus]BBD07832.1 thioredoxin-disulfide reductase [Desulfovibrio ferrophilus]
MKEVQLLIIGQGPAGLSAAIYASRAGIDTLVIGMKPKIDGDYAIDNYFGFENTIQAADLMDAGRKQAIRFGTEIITERVLTIHMEEDMTYKVKTESGHYKACAIIIAAGVSKTRSGIKNEDDYDGKGVSHCVSCDGFFYRGRQVMALGEGVYAANQALELTSYTEKVALCTQGKKPEFGDELKAKLDEAGIPVIEKKIETLEGENGLDRVKFDDGETFDTEGLFIAMGEAGSTDFAYTLGLERNGHYLVANEKQETNLPGIYAAGDCVGRFLQIGVAVGEGSIAARQAIKYAKEKCPKDKS